MPAVQASGIANPDWTMKPRVETPLVKGRQPRSTTILVDEWSKPSLRTSCNLSRTMNGKDPSLAIEPSAAAEMFGAWEPWSGCTMECLGIKRRTRTIAVQGKAWSAGRGSCVPVPLGVAVVGSTVMGGLAGGDVKIPAVDILSFGERSTYELYLEKINRDNFG